MNNTRKEIIDYIEENLSEKRLNHTFRVVREAGLLADRWGADLEKAEIAALFHDMFRDEDDRTLNGLIRQFGIDSAFENNSNLSHGKIAAVVMCREYGITDEDVINAVSYHTTGRKGMSLLEKVVYLADAMEPGRKYPGVEKIRELAYKDIDRACLLSMETTMNYLANKGVNLDDDTRFAAEDLRMKLKKKSIIRPVECRKEIL